MSLSPIPLHCIHAVKETFDPAVFHGREILPEGHAHTKKYIKFEDVIMEDSSLTNVTKATITSIGRPFLIDTGGDRVFTGGITVKAEDKEGNSVPFSQTGDFGKIVTNLNKDVVGIVLSRYENKGKHQTILVSADAFINSPPEHIREYLKDKFNVETLQNRRVPKTGYQSNWVHIEGRPSVAQSINAHYQIEINSQKYQNLWSTHSYFDSIDDTLEGLRTAFTQSIKSGEQEKASFGTPALFSTPNDIGKLVLDRGELSHSYDSANEAIIGVVAHSEEKYSEGHGRWYQTTYIAPAFDFLRP